jgi:hypothetical protein
MKKLIGICGLKKSGKDTVASILSRALLPQRTVRIGFADALKEEVARSLGVTPDYINSNKDNFRLILQGWGTDFRRKLHGEDYWIQKWLSKVAKWPDDVDNILVPDVRFQNEYDVIKELNGVIIRVVRDDINGNDGHQSERESEGFDPDIRILNNQSLNDLDREVRTRVIKLLEE